MGAQDEPIDIDKLMATVRERLSLAGNEREGAMKLSVEEVLRQVQAGAARRDGRIAGAAGGTQDEAVPRWLPASPRIAVKRDYSLHELLAYSDADFVDTAYHVLMRRPADSSGRDYFLHALREGELTKVEILAALRWSDEGKSRGVHVDGLLAPYLIQRARRLPLLGPLISWALGLLQLASMHRRLHAFDAAQARESHELGRHLNAVGEWTGQALSKHAASLSAQEQVLAAVRAEVAGLQQGLGATDALVAGLQLRLAQLEADRVALQAQHVRAEQRQARAEQKQALSEQKQMLVDQQQARLEQEQAQLVARLARSELDSSQLEAAVRQDAGRIVELQEQATRARADSQESRTQIEQLRLAKAYGEALERLDKQVALQRRTSLDLQRRFARLLEDAGQRLPAAVDDQLVRLAAEADHRLDAMYANFEDHFRGSREDIMARTQDYLAMIAAVGAGEPDAPVLDLGCGRGEWLEVLTRQGLLAAGVDLNQVFIAECRARELTVHESDALAYLRRLPDASLGAITSMHLVEHLPLEVLVELIDECLRALRPGGVLILETPNPENLLVGSHYFYLDPTHRNPLPPALLEWLVQARGFDRARVERLHAHRGAAQIQPVPADSPGAAQINVFVELLKAAPDYAVVAHK